MAQLGTDEKPFVVKTGTIASKESRFRKKFNKEDYDFNYDYDCAEADDIGNMNSLNMGLLSKSKILKYRNSSSINSSFNEQIKD